VTIPEIRNFVAHTWDHLQSGHDGQSGPDTRGKLIRDLSFASTAQDFDMDMDLEEPTPVHYPLFFSSLAFPISLKHLGVQDIVDNCAGRICRLSELLARMVPFIDPILCPLHRSEPFFQKLISVKTLSNNRSKSSPRLVCVTYGGSFQVDGNELPPSSPELTKSGFRIKGQFEFETDSTVTQLFMWVIKNGRIPFPEILALLSQTGTLADALVAPNLILPVVLLNSLAFPLALTRRLFGHVIRENRHHFLVRTLFLAEISRTRLDLLFQQKSVFSKPLIILFCASELEWAVNLIDHLAKRQAVEPVRVLKRLVKGCDQLAPESVYILRVMLILSLFTIGDVRSVFAIFLRFISHVFHEVIRVRELPQTMTSMMSQLLVRLERDGKAGKESLGIFTRFLERFLRRVPEVKGLAESESLDDVQEFVSGHEREVYADVKKFMDEKADRQMLIFSFVQNFRFLVNLQKDDRSCWIPLSSA
jgi:hypothetical protein